MCCHSNFKGVSKVSGYRRILNEHKDKLPIGLIAHYRVTYYKQKNNVINCHQCKRKKPLCFITWCTGCANRYCEFCLWNRHHLKLKVI